MRLLEKLPFPLFTQYRVGFDEEGLALLANLFLAYPDEPTPEVLNAALELATILKEVRGDDFRYYQKLAHKLKKWSQRK
jgi:hypothetical protein